MMNMPPFQDQSFNRSFSQLAKESCFTFNLYRGRVDWKKLEMVDVDRIVRDQDVEMLNIHLSNVTNCNLESEYDVKILDPNFIKLFKMAQLLIDFLLHCKQYLEHCIKVAHEIIQDSNKEVEGLRNQLHTRKTEVKQLKAKIKELKLQLQYSQTSPATNKCSLCGKVFLSEEFLDAHHMRRHSDRLPDSDSRARVLKPANRPLSPPPSRHAQQNVCKCDEKEPSENAEVVNIKKKYQEEIEEMKQLFFSEIEKLKQTEVKKCSSKSGDAKEKEGLKSDATSDADKENQHKPQQSTTNVSMVQLKASEAKVVTIHSSTNTLPKSTKDEQVETEAKAVDTRSSEGDGGGGEEEWLARLEQRDRVWRNRLADLDRQYQRQVGALHDKLAAAHTESQDIKIKLEQRLEEVMSKFEQCQAIASKQKVEEVRLRDDAVTQSTRRADEHPTKPMPLVESKEKSPEGLLPFQKRRAFVSQKTKTVQENSFESPNEKKNINDLVRILNPGEDSDLEVIPLESQRTSVRSDSENVTIKNSPLRTAGKNQVGQSSRNTQENTFVKKILEEEKAKESNRKLMFEEDDQEEDEEEETSITETYTETESEISEEDKQDLAGENPSEVRLKFEPADQKSTEKQVELAQQSLQSMERVLVSNPGILGQLRGDLERLVGRRLQKLGVDPAWNRLPPATFENKMAVLQHQRQIIAKNHKVFFTLRDKLDAEANAAVRDRPTPTTAQSLVARLRSRVAKVTRRLGNNFKSQAEKSPAQRSLSETKTPVPLSSSSPREPNQPFQFNLPATSSVASSTRLQESPDSLSLTSSESYTYDRREGGEGEVESVPVKSALRLRNAVSTGSLAKKRVLFVDEPITEEKRSQSEGTVATSSDASRVTNASVSNLAERIEQLLGSRAKRPTAGVDLMKSTPSSYPLDLPLSELLPLSKSGRELLESEEKMRKPLSANSSGSPVPSRVPSPRTSEPLSHILKRVPVTQTQPSLRKVPENLQTSANKSLGANIPQPEKTSPSLSLSSLASSLMYNTAIDSPKKADESLDLDLQDLEENLRF